MLFRFPALITRLTGFAKYTNNECLNQRLNRVIGLEPTNGTPFLIQIRGLKDKETLKLRCNNCYFKKVDDRWFVLCHVYPRHKQREKVIDTRIKWIVTHTTRTGRPFKKHFQYPGQDL